MPALTFIPTGSIHIIINLTPTPTPPPENYSGSSPNAGYINGVTQFPPAAQGTLIPITPDTQTTESIVPGSNSGQGTVMFFNTPILGKDANGNPIFPEVNKVGDIRQINLAVAANWNTSDPVTTPTATYTVWVFKGGQYGAASWNDPNAWDQVYLPNPSHSWSDSGEHLFTLKNRFNYYLNSQPDALSAANLCYFGGTTDSSMSRATGTLTWAVFSMQPSATPPATTPASLTLHHVRAYVYPFPTLAPTPSMIAAPEYMPNKLAFYARMDAHNVIDGSSWKY